MTAARRARFAYWAVPPLLCLLVQWRGMLAWFRADDFAWMGIGLEVHSFRDLLHGLFAPLAQGTVRPLSERAFFMAGFGLFGLDPAPFRVVVFATQFANLALVASIGSRLAGRRAAGFWAAVLWALHGSLTEPLGWACVYNRVMCGFFMLLAFHFLLRWVETGRKSFHAGQWIAFLLGFGALELNVVYPVLAAAYTYLCARGYFRRTLPLFGPSVVYVLSLAAAAPVPRTGDYAPHFNRGMLRTLGTYWTWSAGPLFGWMPLGLPKWIPLAGVALISLGLLVFLARKLDRGPTLFAAAWYMVTIAPVLPLRDHVTEYYLFVPLIGLCWLGGWALAEAWEARGAARIAATALAALYAVTVVPQAVAGSSWNYRLSVRVRNLVEGVAGAHDQHPDKAILLTGVDNDLFWNGVLDRPFRLVGADHTYLAPGSERHIEKHPDLGDVGEYVLPAEVAARALERDQLVVYDVRGPRLRNITSAYARSLDEAPLPLRVDAANPLAAYLLGPEWYPLDGGHRWMPKRATLRMGAPAGAGQRLYLQGYCPAEQLRAGPLTVRVAVDGAPPARAVIRPGENDFELSFPLPAAVAGRPQMQVAVEAGRTLTPPDDRRNLGLAFGVFEVR